VCHAVMASAQEHQVAGTSRTTTTTPLPRFRSPLCHP